MDNFVTEFRRRVDELYMEAYGQDCSLSETDEGVRYFGAQRPKELFDTWEFINEYVVSNKLTELSFLEIGAARGLWALCHLAFCEMHNITPDYTTVTWVKLNPLNTVGDLSVFYDEGTFNLIDANSLEYSTRERVMEIKEQFNIVFVDADHAYTSAKSDTVMYGSLASDIILWHDIRPKECPTPEHCGVYKSIIDLDIPLYKEVVCSQSELTNLMGIGISVIDKEDDSE